MVTEVKLTFPPSPMNESERLNVLVFGAGAIGTYFGGSLILAGHQVVFVEPSGIAAEVRERGLRLDLTLDQRRKTNDAFRIEPQAFVVASSLAEALNYGPFDVGLFALKSFDTAGAIKQMQPFQEKMPPLLCLSNGVDNESMLAAAFGAEKVIPGTVTSAIGRKGAGNIVLEKLRGMGVAAGHPLSGRLVEAFNKAFLRCKLYPEANSMKWSKMLTNLIANPTSAILDMTAAEVFANRKLYRLEILMLRECLAVMQAQGFKAVDLPGTPVRALALAARLPFWLSKPLLSKAAGSGRGAKMPSFHIDLYAGRGKSEVEFLHGAVVRAGKACHVPTPVNQLLTETLLGLTRGEIPLEAFAHQPKKLLGLLPDDRSK